MLFGGREIATIAVTTASLNSDDTIFDCINSIRLQTSKPDTYLVVDANSSDNTISIVKNFRCMGVVTDFISETDRGISHGFNKAWHMANTDYVCNLNADDWLSLDYIEKARLNIKLHQPDILIGKLCFVSGGTNRWITPILPKGYPIKDWQDFAINHPGMIIRKTLLEQVGGYSEKYRVAMDVDLFFKLLRLSPKIVIMEDATVYQRDNGTSQIKWARALAELRDIEISHQRPVFLAYCEYYWRFLKVWAVKKRSVLK